MPITKNQKRTLKARAVLHNENRIAEKSCESSIAQSAIDRDSPTEPAAVAATPAELPSAQSPTPPQSPPGPSLSVENIATFIESHGHSPSESSSSCNPVIELAQKVSQALQTQAFDFDSLGCTPLSFISECATELSIRVPEGASSPSIRPPHSARSWRLNYTMLSFMINGQLFAEYKRIASMLGLPCSSDSHWERTIKWLGHNVERLAEWSCEQVRENIVNRGDKERWVASYDGFYLTRGHYSNNSSATLHDYSSGLIAWFEHRTKRGAGHTWEGTSAGAESDMYNVILGEVKTAGFNIIDMVVDHDSSMNAIYCSHFPEGNITYCSNHSAKTLHKDLQKIKQLKCECKALKLPKCKRMTDAFINSCKRSLNNLISADRLSEVDCPYAAFSSGILNFYAHYCLDDHSSPECYHEKEKDGLPYHVKNGFTCQAQCDGFRHLLRCMADKPQDYVSEGGRMTTNTIEGFHGLALMYRDKRTDLSHTHYTCKTNMAICHKNMGPIWKVVCCMYMGVPVPSAAVSSILREQEKWEEKRTQRSKTSYLHTRNLQKQAKRSRHEREKQHMEELHSAGYTTGQYAGNGQGEEEPEENEDHEEIDDSDSEVNIEYVSVAEEHQEDSPILFLYDCETTGLSIYEDHITEIAAKVIGVPATVTLSQKCFTSLVHTPRYITRKVSEKTGITVTLIRHEKPLSLVLPEFFKWISVTTGEIIEQTGLPHIPVLVAHNGFQFDFPILMAEVDRRVQLNMTLAPKNIYFSDTLPHLRKAKKDKHVAVQEVTKFGLESLYHHFFHKDYSAHRALPDVEAMEQILTATPIKALLSSLPKRSLQQQEQAWRRQKEQRTRTSTLLQALGKKITAAQAKRLDEVGFTFGGLCNLRGQHSSNDAFIGALKKRGIRSKRLHKTLPSILPL